MKGTPLWYSLLRRLAIIIFKVFFAVKIRGKENVPLKGGVILASNHLSYFDPIVLGLLTPRKINFMAKEELFENFLFRLLITKLGAFPVKRERVDKTVYQKVLDLLKKGELLVLFPEGTRSWEGKLGRLQQGTARIALRANVPLVPVIIQGTEKVLPRGKKMIRLAKIEARIGEPLRGKKSKKEDVKTSIERLHKKLENSMRMLLEC